MKACGVDEDRVRDRDEKSTSAFECIHHTSRHLVVYARLSAANKNISKKKNGRFRILVSYLHARRFPRPNGGNYRFNNDAHVSSCHPKPDGTF